MQDESLKYRSKLKLLEEITNDQYQYEDEVNYSVIKDSKMAFNLALAKVGSMLLKSKDPGKLTLEPKVAYPMTVEPVNAVFFEISCGGKPSPILMRIVNDTEGCGIGLEKG